MTGTTNADLQNLQQSVAVVKREVRTLKILLLVVTALCLILVFPFLPGLVALAILAVLMLVGAYVVLFFGCSLLWFLMQFRRDLRNRDTHDISPAD
jgi:hypothetical protein